jgi:hypothetical protein
VNLLHTDQKRVNANNLEKARAEITEVTAAESGRWVFALSEAQLRRWFCQEAVEAPHKHSSATGATATFASMLTLSDVRLLTPLLICGKFCGAVELACFKSVLKSALRAGTPAPLTATTPSHYLVSALILVCCSFPPFNACHFQATMRATRARSTGSCRTHGARPGACRAPS